MSCGKPARGAAAVSGRHRPQPARLDPLAKVAQCLLKLLRSHLNIPPLKEQASIVALLDDLTEQTQRLASLYERKLAALESLKKSILHQAFTGEL